MFCHGIRQYTVEQHFGDIYEDNNSEQEYIYLDSLHVKAIWEELPMHICISSNR